MSLYTGLPAVDSNFNFPPEVRKQIALSDEVQGQSRIVTATSEMFPDLDDTGATDTSAALLAIMNDLPEGSTLKLPGKYYLSTQLQPPAKTLHLDNTGGEFILANSGTGIFCRGAFEGQKPVTALEVISNIMDNNVTAKVHRLTMATFAAAAEWKRGDIVKVLANDVIPAAHVTSETNKPRIGEFATVYSVVGNYVYLSGLLREAEYMTTGIRADRLIPSTMKVTNPSARVIDSKIANDSTVNFIRFQDLVYPQVTGLTVDQMTGMDLSFKSCFGYRVEASMTNYNVDNAGAGVVGYSIHDSSCNFGEVIGGIFMGGRHAYTDGAADIPVDSTDTSSYGATIGTKFIGCKALFMKHAGFDTHHQSLNIEFAFCTVYGTDGAPAFLLRGRKHKITSPTVFGGREILYVGTQVTGAYSEGESWGHELSNFMAEGTERVITDARRAAVAHPNYNVRDDRATRIIGGHISGNKRLFVLVNAAVEILAAVKSELNAVLDAGNVINLTNGALFGTSPVRVDASAVTSTGANAWLINCDDSASAHSIVRLSKLSIKASAAYAAATPSGPITINSQTEEFAIDDLVFENYPWTTSTPIDATDTNLNVQNIRYRVLGPSTGTQPATRSSAWLAKSNASIATTLRNLMRSSDPVLTLGLTISDNTERTLIVLPPGKFTGQMLRILLVSTNTAVGTGVVIQHGAPGNINLTGAVNWRLDKAGQSINAVYAGTTWVQV